MKEFEIKVIETLSVLKGADKQYQKRFCLVQWGDREPVYDLRVWDMGCDPPKPLKGISLTGEEMEMVVEAMEGKLSQSINTQKRGCDQ